MRVAVDASVLQLDVTGVGRVVLGLYGACIRNRPELQISMFHRNQLLCQLPPGMDDVTFAPWLPKSWWRRAAIPAYCAMRSPDVVHFPWNDGVVPLPSKCRKVLTLNDVIPLALPELYFRSPQEEKLFRSRVRENISRADLVITISERSRDDIIQFLKPDKEPVVVYPAAFLTGAGNTTATKTLGLPECGYFLYFGGYEKRKGLDRLVRVFHRLHRERLVEVPLIVAGKRFRLSDDFQKDVKSAVAEGAVIEKGYVNDSELVTLLQHAKALIYPTLYEGFGLPPLEAMSIGCPVLTTRAGAVPEVCGDAAVYAGSDDDDGLARAIVEMYLNEKLRRDCVERGFQRSSKFTWERSAATFLEALDDLV